MTEFSILEDAGYVKTSAGIFYPATYNENGHDHKANGKRDGSLSSISSTLSSKLPVTLLVSSKNPTMVLSKNQFSLSAALCFQDDKTYLQDKGLLQCSNGKAIIF